MTKNRTMLLALGVAAILSGCGKNQSSAPAPQAGNGPAPAATKKLAFVSNNAANLWSFARAGCNEAAKELGNVEVDFRITASGGSAEQTEILNDLVAKGTDGIAVSVNDPDNQV